MYIYIYISVIFRVLRPGFYPVSDTRKTFGAETSHLLSLMVLRATVSSRHRRSSPRLVGWEAGEFEINEAFAAVEPCLGDHSICKGERPVEVYSIFVFFWHIYRSFFVWM